ncbi:MAG: carboxypeptidase regulatory-like domain-containing protein [Chlorobiaceae bacterium]|nr:carboxypeptidase regulatory-like domain-containing protein [Chlorobiaceae bacterium]
MLVGFYVNQRERGTITVQLLSGKYWIPWKEFLAQSGVQPVIDAQGMAIFATSIGEIRFDTHNLRLFNGEPHVPFTALDEQFRVAPSFNPQLFAVMLQIPWLPASPKSVRGGGLQPDVKAPDASVAFVHTGYQLTTDSGQHDSRRYELMSGGRVAGGVWDMELEGYETVSQMQPTHYHWTSLAEKSAVRLGTGVTANPTLLEGVYFTGAQFAFSNRPMFPLFDQPYTSAQETFLNSNGDQRRTIEGTGPPAGIAELRFDDRALARVQIRLDGRFSFPDIQMGSGYRKTEVYLYTRSILDKPDMVLNYTQSIASRALEAGKMLVSGGIGVTGNPLVDPRAGNLFSNPVSFGRFQYGVNRWLTTETSVQQREGGNDAMVGALLSIGPSWNAGAYAALSNARYGTELSIERQGRISSISLRSRSEQKGFHSNEQPATSHQYLYYSLRPRQNINVLLIGQHERSDDQNQTNDISYLRPGLSMFFGHGFGFSVTPGLDQREAYRYELTWNRINMQFSTSCSANEIDVSATANVSEQIRMRLAHQHEFVAVPDVTSAVFNWYPTQNRRAMFQIGGSYSTREHGVSLSYSRPVEAGLEVSIGYAYSIVNPLLTDTSDMGMIRTSTSKHSLNLAISLDFGWSGRRFQPIHYSTLSATRGGIAGSIAPEDNGYSPSSSLDKAGILINGRSISRNEEGGSFFAGSLKPGLYRVTLDPTAMPIELTSDSKGKIVEVKSGAVTSVSIPVYAEYGVAGQLVDSEKNGVPGAYVELRMEGHDDAVGSGITNDFGFYRIDGLRKGHYIACVAKAAGGRKTMLAERRFVISNDYVFDIDLQLPK